jgi:hypothetical protein
MRTLPSPFRLRIQILVVALVFLSGTAVSAQETKASPEADRAQQSQPDERPLPDIPTLMQQVQANLKGTEAARKDYIYHSVENLQELGGSGAVKKTTFNEYDVFWINGVPVRKLVKKNGKELTPEEQKKESERLDKDVAKARERKDKAEAQGKDTTPRGDELVTASRILELGTFSNPRRVKLDGRDTIVADYAGNPKAKTKNRAEDVIRDLVGTVWVDEQDHVLRKTEGHFVNAFKVGAGLVVNIRKDTGFSFEQKKVNGEVWLPARFEGKGAFRYLLFAGFNGRVTFQMSDYRKFKATATILPGLNKVEDGAKTPAPQ